MDDVPLLLLLVVGRNCTPLSKRALEWVVARLWWGLSKEVLVPLPAAGKALLSKLVAGADDSEAKVCQGKMGAGLACPLNYFPLHNACWETLGLRHKILGHKNYFEAEVVYIVHH